MSRQKRQISYDIRDYECSRKTNINDNEIKDIYPNSYQRYCDEKSTQYINSRKYNNSNHYGKRAELSNHRNYDNYRDYSGNNGYYEYNKNFQSRDFNPGIPKKAILLNIVSILIFILVGIMTIYNIRINNNVSKANNDKEIVFIDESRLNITSDGEEIINLSPVYNYK